MSNVYNHVSLIGRTTRDTEVKVTSSGHHIANFTLAVRRDRDNADFISCVAFDQRADYIADKIKKGCRIAITGRIQTSSYDGQNGKVYVTQVVVDSVAGLEPKPDTQNAVRQTKTAESSDFGNDSMTGSIEIDPNDLPF